MSHHLALIGPPVLPDADELDRLRAVDQAARHLVDTCDKRWAAGWTKTPRRDVEALRDAICGDR